jgi:excisionase family DNA binding protein
MTAEDRLITARDAAAILGLSETSVRRLAADHRLPSVRPFGLRARRFRASEVERFARGETDTRRRAKTHE